ncbi:MULTISPECIES: apolipoprotein A1/A4/E family protein [Microvirga]|uniref:apolipoprotein A1/A4/E family protein n=1 Tax=Microvirga TaxID=186650 RepID=UPI001CFE94D1|nr:apolipoprotein A1/A4/E family protein [Microvirga lenta]MCB5173946.1 apolipoprotein A1/A4/E family protein [Microvirga lenta]
MGVGQQNSNGNGQKDIRGDDWDALKEDVGGVAGAAVERGRHFIDAARDQATDYADRRKDDIAQSVADFANSLRDSTGSFEERPNIRAVVDSAAEGLETLADTIRERSFADIFNDFEGMVRRRPATVAAVSVAVGFLTARFIKSTAEELRHDQNISGPARGGGSRGRSKQGQGSRARASV